MKTYKLESDAFQWKIVECYITEKGNPSEKILGYYSTIELAKKASIEKVLKLKGLDDLVEAKAILFNLLEVEE